MQLELPRRKFLGSNPLLRNVYPADRLLILNYLGSAAGAGIFRAIEDKPDDYRTTLTIWTGPSAFSISLEAGELRGLGTELVEAAESKSIA
jgi:hypothetical protein